MLRSHKKSLLTTILAISIVFGFFIWKPVDRQRGKATESESARSIFLGDVPKIALTSSHAITEKEADQIRGLIASIREIKRPEAGLSPVSYHNAKTFSPLEIDKGDVGLLIIDGEMDASECIRDLVALGPKALPFLLESLEDETPTQLIIVPPRGGGLYVAEELFGNPVNPKEKQIGLANLRGWADTPREEGYTIKVGDVCFVIIGQIVGREYCAARYQPSGGAVVNSPTRSKPLRTLVRSIWSSANSSEMLFQSLLQDYSTEGVLDGKPLQEFIISSDLKAAAALRLLFYYSSESAPLIVKRLGSLDVSTKRYEIPPNGWNKDYMESVNSEIRDVSNGMNTKDFIESVAWSDDQAIQTELNRISEKTNDPTIREAIKEGRERQKLLGFVNHLRLRTSPINP